MKIEFTTKSGIVLDVTELVQVNQYYEAACTAEYVLENYPELKLTDAEAMQVGHEVRRRMDKYDCTESEVLYEYIPSLYRKVLERRAKA